MKLNKWLLAMLFPFLAQMNIVPDDGAGGSDDGAGNGDGDDDKSGDKDGAGGSDDDGQKPDNKDGKKISDSEAKLLKDVMAKKTALKEANDKLKAADEKLKSFEGIDPAKVRELLKQQQDAETAKLEAQGQWDKLKAQMAEAHKAELASVQAQRDALQAQLGQKDSTISELTVGNAFANSSFIREELVLTPNKTRAAFGTHFDYLDGAVVGYDKPAGAKDRTLLVDASGEPLSFEDALRKLVDQDSERDDILKSKLKTGGGGKPNPKGGKAPEGKGDETVTGRSRITSALTDFLGSK